MRPHFHHCGKTLRSILHFSGSREVEPHSLIVRTSKTLLDRRSCPNERAQMSSRADRPDKFSNVRQAVLEPLQLHSIHDPLGRWCVQHASTHVTSARLAHDQQRTAHDFWNFSLN